MKIQHILVAMMLACSSQALAQERAMEMRADRTLIYPQRLELKGDETLGDILAIYPDLMQNGFDDMLSGYNVRIDNVAINGDMRIVCRQLKARQISKIQICDNTAVAKGTVGLDVSSTSPSPRTRRDSMDWLAWRQKPTISPMLMPW